MAWTTALGDDLDAVWQRLLAGETGLVEIPVHHPGARLLNGLGAAVAPAYLDPPLAAEAPASLRPGEPANGNNGCYSHCVHRRFIVVEFECGDYRCDPIVRRGSRRQR